jgi:hypothetical protein
MPPRTRKQRQAHSFQPSTQHLHKLDDLCPRIVGRTETPLSLLTQVDIQRAPVLCTERVGYDVQPWHAQKKRWMLIVVSKKPEPPKFVNHSSPRRHSTYISPAKETRLIFNCLLRATQPSANRSVAPHSFPSTPRRRSWAQQIRHKASDKLSATPS